jgi:hypothetical protein
MSRILNVVPESAYRGYDGVNYSSLSNLANSPQSFRIAEAAEESSETSAMLLGTVVDLLLTNKEKFDEEVYVMTAAKPSAETMLMYCNTLAETGDSTKAYHASGYKISPNAVATKFDKEGRAYFDALLNAKGKSIVDAEMLFTANQIVAQLTTNPYTKKYFIEEDGVDLLFQVPIVWEIPFVSLITGENAVAPAKSMLDVIRIDHHNKGIQPVDLKTGGEGFMKSFWRYHRYLQGAMYTDAVHTAQWDRGTDLRGYILEPMRFVYADTNLFYSPTIYKMTEKDVHAGQEGISYIEPIGGKLGGQGADTIAFGTLGQTKRKGYIQLTAELDWHLNNDMWDYPYEIYKKHGEVDINAFGIKL